MPPVWSDNVPGDGHMYISTTTAELHQAIFKQSRNNFLLYACLDSSKEDINSLSNYRVEVKSPIMYTYYNHCTHTSNVLRTHSGGFEGII